MHNILTKGTKIYNGDVGRVPVNEDFAFVGRVISTGEETAIVSKVWDLAIPPKNFNVWCRGQNIVEPVKPNIEIGQDIPVLRVGEYNDPPLFPVGFALRVQDSQKSSFVTFQAKNGFCHGISSLLSGPESIGLTPFVGSWYGHCESFEIDETDLDLILSYIVHSVGQYLEVLLLDPKTVYVKNGHEIIKERDIVDAEGNLLAVDAYSASILPIIANGLEAWLIIDNGDLTPGIIVCIPTTELDLLYYWIEIDQTPTGPGGEHFKTVGTPGDFDCWVTIRTDNSIEDAKNGGKWTYRAYQNYNPVTYEYDTPVIPEQEADWADNIPGNQTQISPNYLKMKAIGTGVPNKSDYIGDLDPYQNNFGYGELKEFGQDRPQSGIADGGSTTYLTSPTHQFNYWGVRIGHTIDLTNPNISGVVITSVFLNRVDFDPLSGGQSVIPGVTGYTFTIKNRSSRNLGSDRIIPNWLLDNSFYVYAGYLPTEDTVLDDPDLELSALHALDLQRETNPQPLAHRGFNDEAEERMVAIRKITGPYGIVPNYGAEASYYTTVVFFNGNHNYYGGRLYFIKPAVGTNWYEWTGSAWIAVSSPFQFFNNWTWHVGDKFQGKGRRYSSAIPTFNWIPS